MKKPSGKEVGPGTEHVACVSCGRAAVRVIVVGEPIAGIVLPPLPVCRLCDTVYRSAPNKRAEVMFIVDAASEMLRLLRLKV